MKSTPQHKLSCGIKKQNKTENDKVGKVGKEKEENHTGEVETPRRAKKLMQTRKI